MAFRHYFSNRPVEKPVRNEINAFIRGFSLKLVTYSGVFSYRRIDRGTRLLAENMLLPDSGDVLDLGCGYGVVGIVAGLSEPKVRVWFIDINPLAISATKQNAKRYLDRSRFTIKRNDCLDGVDKKFNAIFSNPPFSAGKRTVSKFIKQSYEHLEMGGWLEMVARRSKGGNTLKDEMARIFGNVSVIARGSGYQVYHSTK